MGNTLSQSEVALFPEGAHEGWPCPFIQRSLWRAFWKQVGVLPQIGPDAMRIHGRRSRSEDPHEANKTRCGTDRKAMGSDLSV